MDIQPFFTEEEKKQFFSKYKQLLRHLYSFLKKEDLSKMKELMKRVVALDCYGRDKNGINGLLRNIDTALIATTEIGLKRTSVIALLLYRPVMKKIITLDEVKTTFDADVTLIISRLLKTSDLYARNTAVDSENFHKLLFSFAEDVRVILIMIADRLCLMRLGKLLKSDEDRKRLATEVSYLYAPLAHRLGLYTIKSELEDLSLKYTDRKQYDFIKQKLNETKRSRDAYIAEFIAPIKRKLKEAGLCFDFKGRTKSIHYIINKLEKYNGCILADSVGLGKTFTALAVVKYYENRNKSVLVLCPKKLAENWNTYKDNYVNNPIASDRLNYDVLFHTDLSRNGGQSNGLDLNRLNWGNYDLVVIDESHNFRNGIGTHSKTQDNRYQRLMDKVIRSGVKTKVLMLSATPVNNRFVDLKNQLALAYEGNSESLDERLNTSKNVEDIFKQAQKAFNAWSKLPQEERTTDALLRTLDFDFFELLDSVTIARSRKHIEKYYDTTEIGRFPERLKPISKRPCLTDLNNAINYNEIYEQLMQLSLCVYAPSNYIFPSKLQKYKELTHNKGENLTQTGREQGIRRLMRINLLKRLESSVHSFQLTLTRIKELINGTIQSINQFEAYGRADLDMYDAGGDDFDLDDENRLISSSMKVEDNDTEVSLRPKNLSDYLGQEKVKEQLEIFIEAAKSRNEPLDHVLLYGPPGLGKTT